MPTYSTSDVEAPPTTYSASDIEPLPDGNSIPKSKDEGKGAIQGLWDSTIGGLVQTAKHYGVDVPQEHQQALVDALHKGDIGGALSHAFQLGTGPLTGNGLGADLVKAQVNEFGKAKDALTDPQGGSLPMRVSAAAGHALAGAVPLVGPAAAKTGEDLGNPATSSYGAGEAVGNILPFYRGVPGVSKLGSLAGSLAGGAVEELATKAYRSGLKPSTSLSPAEAGKVVQTGLEKGIPISEGGVQKLYKLVQDLHDSSDATIKQGAAAGKTVDPAAVAQRVDQIRNKFKTQVNPTADLSALDSAKQDFLSQHSTPGSPGTQLFGPNGQPITVGATPPSVNPIPVDRAQAIKQGTYQQLRGKYGELGSASVEAQKSLARGIKEEIYQQFPELKGIASQEGDLLGLAPQLEKAVNRIANRNQISLTEGLMAGGAMAAKGSISPHVAVAGLMSHVLTPAVKSRIAIGLMKSAQGARTGGSLANGAGKLTMAGASQRVEDWANQLESASSAPTQ